MKNLKNRILSLITAFAVAFAGVTMPDTGILPGLAVTASADTEFTEAATWTELKNALTAGGNVRLTGDVKAGSTDTALVVPDGTYVILDLNGHTIDRGLKDKNAVSGGNVITVNGNLTLTDSSTGGTITGGKNNTGGGVFVENGATFTMTGGTISGCSAYNGGGVFVGYGTFIMSGGTISGCSSTANGGGVYVYGRFTMTGGTISGCSADYCGGVYVSEDGTFNVSGSPVISGNTVGGAANNVEFDSYHPTKTINVIGTLTTDASIYVNAGKDEAVAVGSDYPLKASDAECFHSDSDGLASVLVTEDNKVKFVGAWDALQSKLNNASTDENAPTKIKLSGDVTAEGSDTTLVVPADTYVILDLNGHTIDRGLTSPTSNGNVITVRGNLTLTDTSTGEPGTITGGNNDGNGGGVFVKNGATFTMSGGEIRSCSADYGGGVYVNGGEFTMTGGTISGCSATRYGGGVYVYGTFTMSGGEIGSCSADYGGGVYVSEDSTFTMSGGTISGCSATRYGGGVYVYKGTFNMSDGTISDCSSTDTGGGVYVREHGTFTMSGGTISGCSASVGGGVYVRATFTMSGGMISGCSANISGGGVHVYDGTFNVSGAPVISGNKVGDAANNVVFDSEHPTKTINVTDALTTVASIYVHAGKGSAVAVGGSGYTLKAADAEFFHSDNDGLASALVAEDNKVKFVGAWGILQSELNNASTDENAPTKITLSGDVTADSTDTALVVPDDTYVILDLNGHTIDRGLKNKNAVENGNVITVNGNLTLTDSSDNPETAEYDGTSTITGGNNDGFGGGVCVNGTFTMSGGTISGCSAKHGGGVLVDGGEFTVSGGTISECKTTDGSGGGVFVYCGEFTMSGGTISGCSTDYSGGGVYVNGTFTMSGGTISGCSATENGGGGVYVVDTFIMSGGEIRSCSTKYDGGGVYVYEDATFTMQGGTISECKTTDGYSGGGVYVYSYTHSDGVHSGTFNISGSPVISGNTASDDTNNVEFDSEHPTKTINVIGKLTTGASIYVHAGKGSEVAVGDGYTLTTADAEYFHSDIDTALASVLDNDKIVFKVDLPDLDDIDSVTYNGYAQPPVLSFGGEALTENKDYTVTCKLGDTVVSETKNAGTYTVIVTGIGAYKGTYEKSYTINKKPVTVTAAAQSVEVDGSIHTSGADYATLTGAVEGHILTAVTLSTANAINTVGVFSGAIMPGAATIKSGTTDVTANYDITYEHGTLTVTKAKAKVMTAPTAKTGLKYTGAAQALLNDDCAANTAMEYAFGTNADTAPADGYSATVLSATNAGTYYIWYRAKADANHYASDPAVLTVKIAKATQTITAESVTATYGETDKSVSASVTAVTTNVGAISYAVKDGSEDYIDVNAASGALTIKKAGTATVIVTAAETANYAQATKEVTVTINKAGINPTLSIQNKTYDGNEITYTIEDNLGSGTVTAISWEKQDSDENWSTVDDTPVNAGKYRGTATIDETDNYFGATTNTAEFTISKAPINPTVEITGTYTYTGEAIMPTFTVKNGDTILAETDYTVSYANNINAGENTASVSVSAAEGGNYTFTDVTENFSIAKAAIDPTVSIENWVFGTTASTPNVTGNPGNGAVTYTYSSDGTSFSKDVPTAVGSYTIKAAVAETANYLGNETTATFEITKVPATVTTAPTAKTMTYNGEPQELVTEGAANGGTMQYSIDGETYSEAIPSGTDAKTYTVYYKVVGDANHSDTAPQSIDVVIAKADATCTAPTANNLTYTGSAQALVTAGTANGGTMHYSLDGTSWNAAIPTGTNAGSYTVYYKVVGDGNHNDTEPRSINVNVGRASNKTLVNITRSMLRTSASISISVASAVPADAGTISGYALSGTASTTGTVTASNAAVSAGGLVTATLTSGEAGDTITIPVKITAQNYDCTISVIVTLTELADPVFTAPTAQTLTYNGSAQELVTAGTVTTGGTMQYSTDGASWSTTVPTGTNADSYMVYYKIDETDEVNGVTSTPVNVSIARKAAVVTADNKTRTTLESDPELTATVTGLVGSDTVNYTLSRAAGEDIGTYTITPSGDTEQGNYTVTYQIGTFTITEGVIAVTGITLNKTSTTLTVGGSETLTATVLPADATNKTVTWTSDKTAVATVANGVVAATGAGTAIITAKAGDKTATCIVTVRSSGGGSYTPVIPYYPTGGSTTTTTTNTNEPKIEGGSGASGWSNIASEIGKTPAGGSVTIDMNGTTIVPTNVLNALKGNDVDLVLDIGGGITWTINGKDIESVSGSIDLGVKLGTSDIPIDVVNNVTGEHYSTTIHLNHSGKFGFKAVMTVPLRKQDAGLYANLYYYNPSKKALEFVSSAKIDKNGNADLDFNHASDYAIVIDDHPLGGRDVTAKTTGSKVKLTWDAAPGAESYTVYIKKNGKYKKFKTTSKTALTVSGLKNGKTYEFLIRYSVDGKLSEIADSYKVSVKVCYKPVLKATTKNGTITLKWSAVNNATEYRVVKYTNGEWKLVKETSKLSQTIRGLNSGKTYKYAVQAKVNGKWTTVSTSDIVTVKAK